MIIPKQARCYKCAWQYAMLHPLLHNMGHNLEFLQMIQILFTNFSILGEGFRYMGQFSPPPPPSGGRGQSDLIH